MALVVVLLIDSIGMTLLCGKASVALENTGLPGQ